MKTSGRGTGARVRGAKGGGVEGGSVTAGWVCWIGDGWTVTSGTGRAVVVSGSCEAGAALGVGGVELLTVGIAPQRSADDGRIGESS